MVSEQMWAVINVGVRSEWIIPSTIKGTRSAAIAAFVDIFRSEDFGRKLWRKRRDEGSVKCVRVTVTVNPPTPTIGEEYDRT